MKLLLIAAALLCVVSGCNVTKSGGCTPIADPDKSVEFVAPLGGTFSVGDRVNVAWKVNPQDIEAVAIQVNTGGNSGVWRNIFKESIAVPGDSDLVCMDTTWVVGQEYDSVEYSSSTTVNLRVAWYNHFGDEWARDESPLIVVNP